MKSALMLVLFSAHLWPAGDPQAAAEANTALGLAREGKYEQAIAHYRAALKLDPGMPALHLNFGLAYLKLNRLADAIPQFQEALKSDPSSFQARVLLRMSYYGVRRFAEAADALKSAIQQQRDNTELRFKLAQSWLKQYDASKNEFRLLLARDPDSAPVHMLLGEVLDAADQEQAIAELETVVKASPREPEAHFGLGYLYWKQKRYEEARSAFEAELAAQPQHMQALTYLADTEMHLGYEKEAEEQLRQALKLDGRIRLAHMDLGILLASKNESNEAAAQFREAIRIDSSKLDAHYRLGQLLLSLGREKEAETEFSQVKQLAEQPDAERPDGLINVPGRQNGPQ
jgi:tetratricopeptide (TPR) repeat protein